MSINQPQEFHTEEKQVRSCMRSITGPGPVCMRLAIKASNFKLQVQRSREASEEFIRLRELCAVQIREQTSVHNTSRREINCVVGPLHFFLFLVTSYHGRPSSTSRPSIQGDSRHRGYVQRHISRRLLGAMVGLVNSRGGFAFNFF